MEKKCEKCGAELIREERRRQVEEEGWTAKKDQQWQRGELVDAAIAYCHASQHQNFTALIVWPWTLDWWKPKDPIRNLVRAGALIAAEIDRLQRRGG